MRIRNHPKIKITRQSFGSDPTKSLPEEEGILKAVRMVKAQRPDGIPPHLDLEIEYEGNRFRVPVQSDDPDILEALCTELDTHCIGMPIRDIYDRDVNF